VANDHPGPDHYRRASGHRADPTVEQWTDQAARPPTRRRLTVEDKETLLIAGLVLFVIAACAFAAGMR
jgi:hypothetical protein